MDNKSESMLKSLEEVSSTVVETYKHIIKLVYDYTNEEIVMDSMTNQQLIDELRKRYEFQCNTLDRTEEIKDLKQLLDDLIFEEYLAKFKDPDIAEREWYKDIGRYK